MTRVYVRTHVALLDDEDYMALSIMGKAAWHTVNMLQGKQTDERFKDRRHLAGLLRKEGLSNGSELVAELEENRWIVELDDLPGISLKGWGRWQASSRNQYMKGYRAARNGNVQTRAESIHVPYRTVPSRTVPGRVEPPAGYVDPDPQLARDILDGIKRKLEGKPE